MTLYEFRQSSESAQHDIILHAAILVGSRKKWPFQYYLFQVCSFYIETQLHFENIDIKGIRSFAASEIPEEYLCQVDISEVL